MKPISRKVLTSSATYYHDTGETSGLDDGPVYGDAVALTRVYVQYPRRNALTSLGEAANDRLQLWFDCVNSGSGSTPPKEMEFYKKDKITYGGVDFLIREAQCLPNPDHRHHWELMLT